ncbi:MAG: glycine dehydrogenase, partial [Nocardioidaceae bacterium]
MTDRPTLSDLDSALPFSHRHIGPDRDEQARMLQTLGCSSLPELMRAAVPEVIRTDHAEAPLRLPEPVSETAALLRLRELAARNRPLEPMIGLGYYSTVTPGVIRRRVLESPAWYTAYTPYQPEISQGRLEALLNFQTMVADLTGLLTANASLLDEGTAAAEAMTLVRRADRKRSGGAFVVDAETLPQTIAVVRTRAEALGIEVQVHDVFADGLPDTEISGVLLQYPGTSGVVRDLEPVIEQTHERGGMAVVAADPLGLCVLRSPGEMGADVVVGNSQRFGVPMFYGGPHAGFICVRKGLERHLPGRLVGVSVDAEGRPAYRLALQTREQHIRRDKATSNICTAQVLLAVVAAMYAVYHGPDGLRRIAHRAHRYAAVFAAGLLAGGVEVVHEHFFDTVLARVPGRAGDVVAAARDAGIHVRLVDDTTVGISTSETTRDEHVDVVLEAFGATRVDADTNL